MEDEIRALVVDHFFDQDIAQLRRHQPASSSISVVPYQRWAIPARFCFPSSAFVGLETAYASNLDRRWRIFSAIAKRQVRWLFRCYQPNILILPTDSIFYFRPYLQEFRNLGVPIFVLQKETTISPITMELHSGEIKEWVPPIFDFTSVCSDRQREFWERAGAPPELIEITGQPRFDFYSQSRSTVRESTKPRLLYLSFDDIAYLPDDHGHASGHSWYGFRESVEKTLGCFSHQFEIVVKHHPQQVAKDFLNPNDVTVMSRESDTRQLILDADLVVGFQTTALFEAAIAQKPSIYVGWGDTFNEFRSGLVPYEKLGGSIKGAASEEQFANFLRDFLADGSFWVSQNDDESLLDQYIGPRDGNNSLRVWQLIKKLSKPQSAEPPSHGALLVRRVLLRTMLLGASALRVLLRSEQHHRRLQKAIEKILVPMKLEVESARASVRR